MKYQFTLPEFPYSSFEIQTSMWSGKSTLIQDGIEVEKSNEKGKPFLIYTKSGEVVKAYPKPTFPDFIPTLEINGVKHLIVPKLKWFQYVLGALPMLLLVAGGAIPALIGILATFMNFNIFRQEGSPLSKYLKVIGIVVASYTIYFVIAVIITMLIQ